MTPEELNELDLFHRNKYTSKDKEYLETEFPKELLRVIYNKEDDLKFNNKIIKGKIEYHFVPGRYMQTGKPFYLHTEYIYDNEGNSTLPEDTIFVEFKDLPVIFPHNRIEKNNDFFL